MQVISHRIRTQAGSSLVEGTVGLCIVIATLTLSLLLIAFIGVVVFYKLKLAAVTTQTAAYASSIAYPSTVAWNHNEQVSYDMTPLQTQAVQYANNALTTTGLISARPPNISVQYSPLNADVLSVSVIITLTGLPLLQGTPLPGWLKMTDSATGVARYDQPPNLTSFWQPTPTTGGGYQLYMPGYSWTSSSASGVANNNDVMNLRSPYFNTAPTIIKMGIPSSGSGDPTLGPGYIGEGQETGHDPAPSFNSSTF
jgi:hypothetical protein